MEADQRVKAAAWVAYTFGLDPVVVLDEPDRIRRAVRVAAHHVIARELEKASKRK